MDIAIPGEITEIVGRLSTGRTSLLLECLAGATRAGGLAGLVDADGAFDPESGVRAGVDLSRVLWVRCAGERPAALAATELLVRCPGFGFVALDMGESPPRLSLSRAFRLRLAVRRSGTALVVLAARRLTGGAATLVFEAHRGAVRWSGPGLATTRLDAMTTRFGLVRARGGLVRPGGLPWPVRRWRT